MATSISIKGTYIMTPNAKLNSIHRHHSAQANPQVTLTSTLSMLPSLFLLHQPVFHTVSQCQPASLYDVG